MTHDATQICPLHFPLVALRDLITVSNPRRTALDVPDNAPVAYATLSNICVHTATLTPMACRMISIGTRALQFSAGDLLVPRQLIALRLGKLALAPPQATPSFCASNLYVIRVDQSRLDGAYLLHVLRQRHIVRLIDAFLQDETGIHPPVSAFFNQLLLTLPPLVDQNAIVAIAKNSLVHHIGQQQQALYFDALARVRRDTVSFDAPDMAQAA